MPNPKDTKEEKETLLKEGVEFYANGEGEVLDWRGVNNPAYAQDYGKFARMILAKVKALETNVEHFPGCHKAHIECANKLMNEARKLIHESHHLTHADLRHLRADQIKWLSSLGGEE